MKATVALCLFTALVCASAAVAQQPSISNSTDPTVSAGERELLAADAAFSDAVQKGGIDAWVGFFADQGVQDTGDAPAVGPAAIRKVMADGFAKPGFRLTWQPQGARSLDSGRLGMTWGRWQEHIQIAEGKGVDLAGQYITVWKKQKDGAWKVIWDGGEAAPPKH